MVVGNKPTSMELSRIEEADKLCEPCVDIWSKPVSQLKGAEAEWCSIPKQYFFNRGKKPCALCGKGYIGGPSRGGYTQKSAIDYIKLM